MSKFAVILPAAGRSTRFGGQSSKIFATLNGQPVLYWAVRAFATRDDVAQIVIACAAPDEINEHLSALMDHQRAKIVLCPGGSCRAESVREGLLHSSDELQWVAIHDAARPLPSPEMIDRVFTAAKERGCAVPAMPVHLTIKEATGPLPAKAHRTVARDKLWAMQTPQAMRRQDLLDAFKSCAVPLDQITDDAQLIELTGKPVWLVQGEERNLKITTPTDLKMAEMLLK